MKVPKDNPVQSAKQKIRITVTATQDVCLEEILYNDDEGIQYANDAEVLVALQEYAADSGYEGDVTRLLADSFPIQSCKSVEVEFILIQND